MNHRHTHRSDECGGDLLGVDQCLVGGDIQMQKLKAFDLQLAPHHSG